MAKNDRAEKAAKIRRLHERVLSSTKATYGQLRVLQVMLWRANFYENETRLSKEQIMELAGLKRTTVKAALKFLRNEGTIRPIRHAGGGYGMATTYSFHAVGQGGQSGETSSGGGGGECPGWAAILSHYETEHEAVFERWIAKLELDAVDGDKLVLIAPTAMTASHIETHHADAMLRIAKDADAAIKRIRINPRDM